MNPLFNNKFSTLHNTAPFSQIKLEHFEPAIMEGMRLIEEGTISADFLMVHSDDDNWMSPEASAKLYEKAVGYKEKIQVVEKPAYASEETIMHAMPVGEQYHWVKHIAADFIAARLNGRNK